MFNKVLIANRGEIALRINRACQELGVRTVAVFSEADRESLHVRQADEAFCVGPGPVPRSYLNIPNIISTALVTGCDAIHPGYGFLAENARFAEICADHGLTFIGPKPSVIAAMGDKATAKRVMKEAGVATTPGTDILASVAEAKAAAETVGYPVLLKATAGGGGKGMRVVERPEEMERAYSSATAEAEASFKDGRVYMEKLILNPRHIEVQVLGDEFGNVVSLGERDCSVQKPSHQKLIEESPAPHLTDKAREALLEMAVRACKHVGYTNAGTLEFLVSGENVYFMARNTRLQVEHPVTEMVYSVDLV
ncbi:MAG: ATP-grasp domain-containing protein, partial [bacterium]|nr:ATP-grasp domain-containing protein [bacterium]